MEQKQNVDEADMPNSPEYYTHNLTNALQASDDINNLSIPNDIIQLIGEFAGGILSIYIDKPGQSKQYSKFCHIGRNDDDLHLTNNSFSIECWIKLKFSASEAGNTQGDQTIVGNSQPSKYRCLHCVIRNMRARIDFYYNGISSQTVLSKNEWYHLVFIYDKKDQSQSIWINGKLDAKSITGTNTPLQGNYDLYISHYADGRPLQGWLRELRIWNCVLSQKDILQRQNVFNMSENEIDEINDSGKNIRLRKLFCVNKRFQWVQKVPDYTHKEVDSIIQYA